MLATLIEVDVPRHKVAAIQERLVLCVLQTGDELIGYRAYADGSVLFLVKLKHNDYIPKHQVVLGPSLQAGSITSFTIRTCALVKLIFNNQTEVDRLHTFPLCEKEAWFPSLNVPNEAYLCLRTPLLSNEQSQWIFSMSCMVQQG